MTNAKIALATALLIALASPVLAKEKSKGPASSALASSQLDQQNTGFHPRQSRPASIRYSTYSGNYDRAVNGSDASTPGRN